VDGGDASPDTRRTYGEALLAAGRAAEAEPVFRQALGAGAGVAARVGLARSLRVLDRVADAEATYLEAVEVLPSYAPAALGLAELRWEAGRRDEAIQTLIAFLDLDPGHVEGLVRLGCWLQETGREKHAARALDRALHLDPSNRRARQLLDRFRGGGG